MPRHKKLKSLFRKAGNVGSYNLNEISVQNDYRCFSNTNVILIFHDKIVPFLYVMIKK